uniref:Uncharacterized protein n=1 Tax=Timema tahoe TaxID=61484 RepID=A0A7R9FIS4_9NEOP|nr:unnamed protein product [Timema tahoe]
MRTKLINIGRSLLDLPRACGGRSGRSLGVDCRYRERACLLMSNRLARSLSPASFGPVRSPVGCCGNRDGVRRRKMKKSPCLVLRLMPVSTWGGCKECVCSSGGCKEWVSAPQEDVRRGSGVSGGHKEFHRRHKEYCEDTLLPPTSPCTPSSPEEDYHLQPDIDSHPASRVLPFLYLGNARDAADLETLKARGITRVLNVTSHLPGYHEERGITYRQLPASDSGHQNIKQYFEEAFHFIGNVIDNKLVDTGGLCDRQQTGRHGRTVIDNIEITISKIRSTLVTQRARLAGSEGTTRLTITIVYQHRAMIHNPLKDYLRHFLNTWWAL